MCLLARHLGAARGFKRAGQANHADARTIAAGPSYIAGRHNDPRRLAGQPPYFFERVIRRPRGAPYLERARHTRHILHFARRPEYKKPPYKVGIGG